MTTLALRLGVIAICLNAGVALGAGDTGKKSREIWLSAVDPVVAKHRTPGASSDYMHLFDYDAPWDVSSKRLTGLVISTEFAFGGSERDLRTIISYLKSHNLKLMVSGLMLQGPPGPKCGLNVEGYAAPGWLAAALQHVKNLGGVVDDVAMDEPLWFGHVYDGHDACKLTLSDASRQVATAVKQARVVFPLIVFGDTEPSGGAGMPSRWPQIVDAWCEAYRTATGEDLAFFNLDVQWAADWKPGVRELRRVINRRGVPYGLVYNGLPMAANSAAWVTTAISNFTSAEADPTIAPDRATIATWDDLPKKLLPEAGSDTLTGVLLRYERLIQ